MASNYPHLYCIFSPQEIHLALSTILFIFYLQPTLQDTEAAVKGKFDAVLDTIGVPETERIGISVLRRGGHYMTLQVINLHFGSFCASFVFDLSFLIIVSCNVIGRSSCTSR